MLRFACVLLCLSAVIALELQAQIGNQWLKFKAAHGKKYSGAEEEKRKMVFKMNVEAILQHNLQHDLGQETFTQGINQFSDMPHDEFVKVMCGVKGPRPNYTDAEVFVPSERADIPDSIDWRQKNAVTAIKNQETCGSCWTFSAVGAIEGAWAVKTGNLITLSEQQLLDCASQSQYNSYGCEGGWPYQAIRYVADNKGIVKGDCYPYTNRQQTCKYYTYSTCKAATVSKYVTIKPGNENALKEANALNGPISVCVDASQPSFQSYRSGIYNPSYCSQETDHAVLLVGYGSEGGKDYWLVKNSWGTSWGDRGYFKLARNANSKCGITSDIVYAVI